MFKFKQDHNNEKVTKSEGKMYRWVIMENFLVKNIIGEMLQLILNWQQPFN
jgi:hypothetical protein